MRFNFMFIIVFINHVCASTDFAAFAKACCVMCHREPEAPNSHHTSLPLHVGRLLFSISYCCGIAINKKWRWCSTTIQGTTCPAVFTITAVFTMTAAFTRSVAFHVSMFKHISSGIFWHGA